MDFHFFEETSNDMEKRDVTGQNLQQIRIQEPKIDFEQALNLEQVLNLKNHCYCCPVKNKCIYFSLNSVSIPGEKS